MAVTGTARPHQPNDTGAEANLLDHLIVNGLIETVRLPEKTAIASTTRVRRSVGDTPRITEDTNPLAATAILVGHQILQEAIACDREKIPLHDLPTAQNVALGVSLGIHGKRTRTSREGHPVAAHLLQRDSDLFLADRAQ